MELSVLWTLLGGTVFAGRKIGFDIAINDNHTGTRETKLSWWDSIDNAWLNPSLFGIRYNHAGVRCRITPF